MMVMIMITTMMTMMMIKVAYNNAVEPNVPALPTKLNNFIASKTVNITLIALKVQISRI
jgi:hypothetical protein